MTQEIKLNEDQQAAVENGKKIGFLIAALNLPIEEKEQMLKLLPDMTLEQLNVLSAALEKNFLAQAGKQADIALRQGLEGAKEEYRGDMLSAQSKAAADLAELEKKITE
ncbi:MAG: hypothetical protein NTW66_02295 [Candidatus Magasanikbacteria bacterium]|nr:hypothetical protein [Candidatus Magasanikbacteria bacterium]